MRWLLPLLCLSACDGSSTNTDGPSTTTTGDDDDTAPPTDTDTARLPCEQVDVDGDGVSSCDDCDDDDPDTYPGAEERCDGLDNDCDGAPHPEESSLDCAACDAAGWWNPTRGLSGDSLIAELHTLTAGHSCFDYTAATTFMFVEMDNVGDEVECVYTGRHTAIVGGQKPDATDMNTEHTWPQSLGAENVPAKCDLNHLFPTDADANNARAAYPLADVVTVTSTWGESVLGRDASGNTVFEPRDAHKGNAARALLYFAMRYGYPLTGAETARYQAWSALDPVDPAETARSEAIAVEQGSGNPYVLCPWLVDRL